MAQTDDFFEPKTTLGGYGELHFNYEKPQNTNPKKTLDFHRFVLFLSHSWSEKWSFKSEIELEHNVVNTNRGDLQLEQAFLNYHMENYLGFQAGVLLVSAGLINEFHEPPLFFGVERPDYHKYILPTTWFGNGAAVYGYYKGFDYKFSILEGLNSDKFSLSTGIRDGRQKGFKSKIDNLLFNFRLDYLNIPGLKVGFSTSFNKASGDSTENSINVIELHAKYHNKNLYLNFEIGNISYSTSAVKNSRGYYGEIGYNLKDIIGLKLIPWIRFTDYNTVQDARYLSPLEEENHFKKWVVGFSLLPLDEIVLKADYGIKTRELQKFEIKEFNLAAGFMF